MESHTTSKAVSVSGTYHYIPPISAFEPTKNLARSANINTLLWVGGLYDTYHSTNYPYTLAEKLPPTWSLVQIILSSSGWGWGTGSLGQDIEELEKAVRFFREKRPGGKVVIMGHSTGCQDGIHYVVSPTKAGSEARAPVDGLILQAPVSDKEALQRGDSSEYDAANKLALEWTAAGKEDDCLPLGVTGSLVGPCPLTARRWLSLASPDGTGEDDYFSSDLSLETLKGTFGKIPKTTPLLILFSGEDESVRPGLNKEALLSKWVDVVQQGGGVVDPSSLHPVPDATHNLNGNPEPVVAELCKRVTNYLGTLDKHETES